VPGEAIVAAVGAQDGSVDAERAARLLAGRGDRLSDEMARSRAFAYLRRRGYPAEVAYDAVRRAESRPEAA
jgi:SOS response regulatory protein OraA/RecX